MQIDHYFEQVKVAIDQCSVVYSSEIDYDRRDNSTGFIRGNILFQDVSILHVREFVSVMAGTNRLMYSYQYMSAAKDLIFRYDDADHHRHLRLPTHPHHKHDGSEQNIVASHAPMLADVLAEIEQIVRTP